MPEHIIDTANMEINCKHEITRCSSCKWLGRETVVAGEYRCERTDRVTCLEDFCSRAVRQ